MCDKCDKLEEIIGSGLAVDADNPDPAMLAEMDRDLAHWNALLDELVDAYRDDMDALTEAGEPLPHRALLNPALAVKLYSYGADESRAIILAAMVRLVRGRRDN